MTLDALLSTKPAYRPPLTLILGPAGAGKTAWALSRFLADRGRALLLVSSTEQAETRAAQAAARTGRAPAEFRSSIYTFRSLTSALLDIGQEGDRTIGRAFGRLILADIVKRSLRADDYFGLMLRAPGFVPALTERIRDWKLACITPDQMAAAAEPVAEYLADPAFARKAREMARLYRAYEEFLSRNHLRDEEDLLREAAARVAAGAVSLPWSADCLLVDGFYRFNPAQRRLLAALAGSGEGDGEVEIAVTLPYDPARSLLFAAPERTLQTLRAGFACREETLVPPADPDSRVLTTLSTSLFSTDCQSPQLDSASPVDSVLAASPRLSTPPQTPERLNARTPEHPTPNAQYPVLLFDAPNPYVEAEMVAREFRRLHAQGGYIWSDFAVILRAMGDYAPILAAVFERYGIPIGVDGPELLAENPLLKTVLHLLSVVRYGWQRDDVLAFMKSSYTAPSKLEADELRRRARAAGVREGREVWLELLEQQGGPLKAVAGPLKAVAEPLREMARYEALLTAERADAARFADLIGEMIATFGLEERIGLGESTRRERDRAALQTAQELLYALAQMFTLAGRGPVTFQQFHDELLAAWRGASALGVQVGDMVHVAEPYDAHERSLKVAAVMGLTERVFPRRITEDPFLRDEERVALRTLAGMDLEEQKGRADDERFLFYLAVTAPAERLILSYPRSADESDTLPSFFLDEVRAVLGPGQLQAVARTLSDVAPRPEEVVSASDRLLSACADLFDPTGAGRVATEREAGNGDALERLRRCLEEDPVVVRAVLRSRSLPHLPRLTAPGLRRRFAAHRSVYSAADLEAYGRCPLQYLLGHVLNLRPEEDPGQQRTQGALLHGVLRRYYRRRAGARQNTQSYDADAMRAELNRLLEETLAQERLDAGPHQLRMTHRLLADALNGFVEREERFTTQFGMTPTHFELTFGMNSGAGAAELSEWEGGNGAADCRNERDGDPVNVSNSATHACDPASCAEPLLLIPEDEGRAVAICGVIDRVDLHADGRRALALDYTLGRPPDYAEIQRGASLEMPLHLLALERLFDKVGAVACYDSSRERGRRRFQRLEHVNVRQFGPLLPLEDGVSVTPLNREQYVGLMKTAETTAIRLARAIETAEIPATPGDHCRQCAYSDICRTTVLNGHDGEQPGDA
jgi:superfamily I DNA/RNA helicase